MGDRYFVTLTCECGLEVHDAYYAPTCGITHWTCELCGEVIDLEEYTGITEEEASNDLSMENPEFREEVLKRLGKV